MLTVDPNLTHKFLCRLKTLEEDSSNEKAKKALEYKEALAEQVRTTRGINIGSKDFREECGLLT